MHTLKLIFALARACSSQELNVLQVIVLDYCRPVPCLPGEEARNTKKCNAGQAKKSVPQSSRFQIKSPLLRLESAAQVGWWM
jgi:hypothetical protein